MSSKAFMPLITSIKLQRNKKRANVYIDGKFGFSVDSFNLLKFGLKEGERISEEKIIEIIKEAESEKVWEKLLKFVSFRQRTEKEVKDWFERRKLPVVFYKRYLKKLKKLNLVDDKRFAYSFVQDRLSFSPRPKKVLIFELLKKGVSREVAEEVLESFDIDEESQAKRFLAKQEGRWKGLDPVLVRQRKMRFLLSKGYSFEVVKKVIFDEK